MHDIADMISGKSAAHPTAFSGAASALQPGTTKGGTMAAMESSGPAHGSVSEDFVSCFNHGGWGIAVNR